MKILHIVGNRPQFIKLAPVSREIQRKGHEEIIVHTGQHYDENMSDIFFEELNIPHPKANLNVGSGSHAQVISKVISRLEEIIIDEQPDCVLIYGDTNSTLAAAVTVSKLNIPLFHVEAGPRTYVKANPEEQNRIAADHLSDYLFAPDKSSVENLKKEGIALEQIIFSGDVMYDQFLYSLARSKNRSAEKYPDNFILMTCHRQENTCNKKRLDNLLSFIEKINYTIIFPIHPRTKKLFAAFGLWDRVQKNKNLIVSDPIGYEEMTMLLSRCKLLISDSGGASKEASFVGKKCFFPLNLAVWPELIKDGYIDLVNIEDEQSVLHSLNEIKEILYSEKTLQESNYFGNGNAAEIIVSTIENVINSHN